MSGRPAAGLDARAANIVMRCVKSIVQTGRTIVSTIHQPSIDIFEQFDELVLLKRGGETIYCGPLGLHSKELIAYFQVGPCRVGLSAVAFKHPGRCAPGQRGCGLQALWALPATQS